MDRDALLTLFATLAAGHPGIEVKGKKIPYTAVNGNMFAFLSPEGALCVRLSDEDRAAFGALHGDRPVLQYGAVMRGYVELPEAVLADGEGLADLFDRSVIYANSLKPKATKRG